MDDPDHALAELYAGDPSTFTTRRAALAKELQAQGAQDAATRVQTARKPTLAAWVVNRFALDHPDVVETLFELGAELVAAQRRALAGRADELRALTGRRRDVVSTVAQRAIEHAHELDVRVSGAVGEEVRVAFDVALADPEVAMLVRGATLERAPAPAAGFGPLEGIHAVGDAPSVRASATSSSKSSSTGVTDLKADRKAAARARAIADQQARVDELARAARTATKELDRARREAHALDTEVDATRAALRDLEATLETLALRAQRAATAVASAERTHADAVAEVKAAEARLDELTAET